MAKKSIVKKRRSRKDILYSDLTSMLIADIISMINYAGNNEYLVNKFVLHFHIYVMVHTLGLKAFNKELKSAMNKKRLAMDMAAFVDSMCRGSYAAT